MIKSFIQPAPGKFTKSIDVRSGKSDVIQFHLMNKSCFLEKSRFLKFSCGKGGTKVIPNKECILITHNL